MEAGLGVTRSVWGIWSITTSSWKTVSDSREVVFSIETYAALNPDDKLNAILLP